MTTHSSGDTNELFEALAAAQAELKAPAKNKTAKIGAQYSYKYADLADVAAAIFAVLPKHGLCISQPTRLVGDVLTIETILGHKSGQWMSSEYPVCRINGDHKQMGGAMTYARRYAVSSVVGIAPDEDTDGAGAANPSAPQDADTGEVISEAQLATLRAALDETEADIAAFCQWMKVEALPDIRAADYGKAMKALDQKRAMKPKRQEVPA